AVPLDQDVNVTVAGNNMSDVLTIGFNRASVPHQIHVAFDGGDGGTDELIGPDRATKWQLTAPSAGTLDDGSFSGIERVKGGAADNTFVVLDASTTTAVEGGAGNNTLVGADADNAWAITGSNSGTLNGQSFSGVQNVTGGAGN